VRIDSRIGHRKGRHSRLVSRSGSPRRVAPTSHGVNPSGNPEKVGQVRNDKRHGTSVAVYRILFLFFLLLGPSLANAEGPALKKATFIPQWTPQAQFAGYYVAYEKGFYKKNGIDLTLLQGGPNHVASAFLVEGKVDFATMWLSNGIRMRASGDEIVNIAQIIQRSALLLVSKRSSNIRTPQDMNGKKVGLWGGDFQIQPKAFFKKYNLRVKVIPQSFSVNLFLRGGVDVASAMWHNEYHTILNAGLDPEELSTFFFHEHGLNFPEDGLYTLKKTLRKDPDLSRAFVRASLEGWVYAFSHPQESLDIVVKFMAQDRVPVNRTHQMWMLKRMKDLILPPDQSNSFGILQPSDYQRVAQELKESGLIKKVPEYRSFFFRCDDRAEK
jgi:NitT/TauT family transport system substrate-binding protein